MQSMTDSLFEVQLIGCPKCKKSKLFKCGDLITCPECGYYISVYQGAPRVVTWTLR